MEGMQEGRVADSRLVAEANLCVAGRRETGGKLGAARSSKRRSLCAGFGISSEFLVFFGGPEKSGAARDIRGVRSVGG